MAMIVFLSVAALAAYKVFPEVQVPHPFEWVGELFAGVVSLVVGVIPALALHLVVL